MQKNVEFDECFAAFDLKVLEATHKPVKFLNDFEELNKKITTKIPKSKKPMNKLAENMSIK
jgi:hypothetical protein